MPTSYGQKPWNRWPRAGPIPSSSGYKGISLTTSSSIAIFHSALAYPSWDKLRGCDDMKDSLANTACSISAQIVLRRWGHIAEASVLWRLTGATWDFGKIDQKAARKSPPYSGG